MRAEALLDFKDVNRREKRGKRRHLQAVNQEIPAVSVEEKRKLPVRILLKILVVTILAVSIIVLLKSYAASFKVEHVLIEGEFHNAQAVAIEQTLKPYIKGDLITIDLNAAHSALEHLPWIHNARLQRQWPNKILVRIQEQVPVARWNENVFVNAEGEMFRHDYVVEPEKLPKLSGPADQVKQVLSTWKDLDQILAGNQIQISELKVDERNTWTLITADNVVMHLGSRDIESRLQRFLAVMRSDRAPKWKNISSVDLRHSNGFAISWRNKQVSQS